MTIGLRIDVDTFRGTRDGVPALCRLLAARGLRATFFFSVGPDNMGRHLWRLARPAFLLKMARSRAASLYGWDILSCGVFGPGPRIARALGDRLRRAAGDGHELGLHAWDHYAWQAHIARRPAEAVRADLARGAEALAEAAGAPPVCSAAPGWRCTDAALLAKAAFPFRYNSDCRGRAPFRPVAGGVRLSQPQVPATLPTYDELIGREGVDRARYNAFLLGLVRPGPDPVLTIHAEAEGIACAGLFEDFLARARALGHDFVPLGDLLERAGPLPDGRLAAGRVSGRDGWVSVQQPA